MQLRMKRGRLLLGFLAVLIVTIAFASSSASATSFCGGQKVNNNNKCWGASRPMQLAYGLGESTGVCVGADLTAGSCAPAGQWAVVGMPYNWHAPWVIGTASVFTVVSPLSRTE
jgi:hypothetical protein